MRLFIATLQNENIFKITVTETLNKSFRLKQLLDGATNANTFLDKK